MPRKEQAGCHATPPKTGRIAAELRHWKEDGIRYGRDEAPGTDRVCSELPSGELSRDRGRFVGEIAREQQVFGAQRIIGLLNKSFRLVVLRARVSIVVTVIDAAEIAARAAEHVADAAFDLTFGLGRRRL